MLVLLRAMQRVPILSSIGGYHVHPFPLVPSVLATLFRMRQPFWNIRGCLCSNILWFGRSVRCRRVGCGKGSVVGEERAGSYIQ